MLFRRTKRTRNLESAIRWLASFADEEEKYEHNKTTDGFENKARYHTSRPSGLVTAHGYIRPQIELIKLYHQLDDNLAFHVFMSTYGKTNKAKGRTLLGLRAMVSLDSTIFPIAFTMGVDLDNMLVQCVETTAANLSKHYYSGEELGFFLRIHHNPKHIQGHLFLLPCTEKRDRICMSNRSILSKIGIQQVEREDMLDHWRLEYKRVVAKTIYSLIAANTQAINQPIPEDRIAIAQAALVAYQVGLDIERGPEMEIEARRKKTIFDFVRRMRTLTLNSLERLYSIHKQQLITVKEKSTRVEHIQGPTEEFIKTHTQDVRDVLEDRNAEIETMIRTYRENKGPVAAVVDNGFPRFWPVDTHPPLILTSELEAFFKYQKTRKKARRVGALDTLFRSCQLQFLLRDTPVSTFETIEASLATKQLPYALPVENPAASP